MRIFSARIVQIVALPAGWRLDADNRCPGMALVELTGTYHDGTAFEGREVLPLQEDLTLALPKDVPADDHYNTHVLGDSTTFIRFEPEDA